MGTAHSQTPSQTAQRTNTQDQKTGPALAKSNRDANASLPVPPNGGGLDKLKKDLGTVTGMDGFCSAVGHFLDGLAIGKGTSTKGQLEAKISIPKVAEIKASYDFSASRDEHSMQVEGNVGFQASKVFSLLLADVKVGVYMNGGFKAKGDSGGEIMRLVSLAMLPKVQAVSTKLANYMYGDVNAFRSRVQKDMDAEGSPNDEEDWVKTSLEGGLSAGFETTGQAKGVEGQMQVGYRSQNKIGKGKNGKVSTQKEGGLTLKQTLKVGDLSWGFSFDQVEGECKLTSENELNPANMPVAHVVTGVIQSIPSLIDMVVSAIRKTGKSSPLFAGLALARNKIVSSHVAALSSIKPKASKIGLDFELSVNGGGGEFSVVLSSILGMESETAGQSLKASLKSGQDLLRIKF